MAPKQFGKPHFSSKRGAQFSHSREGSGMNSDLMFSHIAIQTSITTALTVEKPTLKLWPIL
jgi:hypothetical protein